jgi:hypothetical protein
MQKGEWIPPPPNCWSRARPRQLLSRQWRQIGDGSAFGLQGKAEGSRDKLAGRLGTGASVALDEAWQRRYLIESKVHRRENSDCGVSSEIAGGRQGAELLTRQSSHQWDPMPDHRIVLGGNGNDSNL